MRKHRGRSQCRKCSTSRTLAGPRGRLSGIERRLRGPATWGRSQGGAHVCGIARLLRGVEQGLLDSLQVETESGRAPVLRSRRIKACSTAYKSRRWGVSGAEAPLRGLARWTARKAACSCAGSFKSYGGGLKGSAAPYKLRLERTLHALSTRDTSTLVSRAAQRHTSCDASKCTSPRLQAQVSMAAQRPTSCDRALASVRRSQGQRSALQAATSPAVGAMVTHTCLKGSAAPYKLRRRRHGHHGRRRGASQAQRPTSRERRRSRVSEVA